jgi:hypothetical protein
MLGAPLAPQYSVPSASADRHHCLLCHPNKWLMHLCSPRSLCLVYVVHQLLHCVKSQYLIALCKRWTYILISHKNTNAFCIENNVRIDKGKVVSLHAMKMYRRSRDIAPPLNLSSRWSWVVYFMPWLLYPWERTPVPTEYKAGWATGHDWTVVKKKNFPTTFWIWTLYYSFRNVRTVWINQGILFCWILW